MMQIILVLLVIAIGVWVVGKLGGSKEIEDAGGKATKKLGGCVLQLILIGLVLGFIVFMIASGSAGSGY